MSTDSQQRWDRLHLLFDEALDQPLAKRREFVEQRLNEGQLDKEFADQLWGMLDAHEGPPLAMEEQPWREPSERRAPLPEQIGTYRVKEEIARGGMGQVLLAERADDTFDRQVAIKLLARHVPGAGWQSRFLRERQIHARLNHPNIAALLDAGVTDADVPYLVMDYVDGQTVLAWVQDQRATLNQRLRLMTQICEAVAFAHSQLVLHRDIKPSNILVTPDGQVKLLDFGIATLLDEQQDDASLTRTGEKLMTPRYASPEQIRGESLAVTSDVYSLGVLLYELITDTAPFDANSDWSLADKIVHQAPTPPNELAPTAVGGRRAIPVDLQAICLKALEKSPADRYQTAQGMADDLQRFINHETVSARRPNWFERLRRLFRRHPLAAPLSLATVVAISATAGVALWQAEQARAERDHAQQLSNVLVDLFDSDPFAEAEERRDDITLREFIQRRADVLNQLPDDQAALKASLFQLFAQMMANLDQIDEASRYAEQAVALHERVGNRQSEGLALSLNTLGKVRLFQSRFEEAQAAYRQSLEELERIRPEHHLSVATAVNDLSVALGYWNGDQHLEEILQLDQRALSIHLALFGDQSLEAAQSYNSVAAGLLIRRQAGDAEQAAELFTKALAIRRTQLGDQHARTLTVMTNLANVLHDVGEFDQAAQTFEQALTGFRASLGERSMRVADTLYGYADLLRDVNDLDGAEAALSDSLSIYQQRLPGDHPYIPDTMYELAQVQLAAGKVSEAINQLREAEGLLADRSDSKSLWHETRFALAKALVKDDQPAESRSILDQLMNETASVEAAAAFRAKVADYQGQLNETD